MDDNEYVRLYIKKLISHVGLGCLMACDAQEALGLIARHSPFLAILDIEMPGMSGPELGWRIKCERPEIHIAAISGHYGTWEPDDLYDLGFERLFWKPLDREEFLKYCLQVDGEMALGHAVTK